MFRAIPFALLLSWGGFVDWLSKHLLTCPSKHFFHMDCPGCGLQRSALELLKGNFSQSIVLYPATIPIFVLFFYTILHLIFKFKGGATIIKWGYIGCTVIIFAFYIYKITTFKIITL